MMYSQKKIGNDTEKEFAIHMYRNGWWIHIFADKVNGQPFDIVMSKNNTVWFLDVKHVKDKDYLLHSRIEQNQINAFTMLMKRGTNQCGFVVKFNDGWYLLRFQDVELTQTRTMKEKMTRLKSITRQD